MIGECIITALMLALLILPYVLFAPGWEARKRRVEKLKTNAFWEFRSIVKEHLEHSYCSLESARDSAAAYVSQLLKNIPLEIAFKTDNFGLKRILLEDKFDDYEGSYEEWLKRYNCKHVQTWCG